MNQPWIDISVTIHSGMPFWPDNPPINIQRQLDINKGDNCNVSEISMGVHTGTHMDAPLHFFPQGADITTVPFDAVIGPARVIEIHDTESIKPAELEPHHIRQGERILFKTINSTRYWQSDTFVKDFVYISQEAARYLAAQQIQTVGVDYLSVGGFYKDGTETHQALLGAHIWIIEGLNLSAVSAGSYELLCLPLKIAGSEGAPSRALLRPTA
jgi:arylformamidase